jgi:hypothetical protein
MLGTYPLLFSHSKLTKYENDVNRAVKYASPRGEATDSKAHFIGNARKRLAINVKAQSCAATTKYGLTCKTAARCVSEKITGVYICNGPGTYSF